MTDERGMILVNVLLFVAIASAVVALMLSSQDIAGERSAMLADAARAEAIARGGELSAIVALRRDAIAAPTSDYVGEPWGAVSQRDIAIAGGRFDLAVADAQSRFNVNALAGEDPIAIETLAKIATALRLPPDAALRAAALIRTVGPIADLTPLRFAGLDPATSAQLSELITAVPGTTTVNLNSASEPLIAIMTGDAARARMLVALRARRGFLTGQDFAAMGLPVPAGGGFTSDLYWVRTRVTVGETRQQLTSLIARRRDEQQRLSVAAIGRWRGAAAPDQAGPLFSADRIAM